MNEFKGTPGPWVLGNVNHFHAQYVNKEGLEPAICSVLPLDEVSDGEWQRGRESQANARLISASHEMLKACQAAIAYDRAIARCGDDPETMASFCTAQGDDLDTLYAAWIDASREALEKALGK